MSNASLLRFKPILKQLDHTRSQPNLDPSLRERAILTAFDEQLGLIHHDRDRLHAEYAEATKLAHELHEDVKALRLQVARLVSRGDSA